MRQENEWLAQSHSVNRGLALRRPLDIDFLLLLQQPLQCSVLKQGSVHASCSCLYLLPSVFLSSTGQDLPVVVSLISKVESSSHQKSNSNVRFSQ